MRWLEAGKQTDHKERERYRFIIKVWLTSSPHWYPLTGLLLLWFLVTDGTCICHGLSAGSNKEKVSASKKQYSSKSCKMNHGSLVCSILHPLINHFATYLSFVCTFYFKTNCSRLSITRIQNVMVWRGRMSWVTITQRPLKDRKSVKTKNFLWLCSAWKTFLCNLTYTHTHTHTHRFVDSPGVCSDGCPGRAWLPSSGWQTALCNNIIKCLTLSLLRLSVSRTNTWHTPSFLFWPVVTPWCQLKQLGIKISSVRVTSPTRS